MYKNKKAQLGLELAKPVAIAVFILLIVLIAVAVGAVSIRDSGILTNQSTEDLQIKTMIANTTKAGTNLFKQIPTVFTVIGVVVIIAVILLLVRQVKSQAGGGI